MYKNNKIGVVVPAYNEASLIGKTILGIPNYVDKIVAVDDSSTDKTYKKLRNLQAKNKKLTVVKHRKNLGVGGSIMSGYKKLFDENIDIAVVMAGDNQMDPQYLPSLLNKIIENGFDVAKGNRFMHRKELARMPFYRFVGNIFLTFLAKLASGYWSIFDVSNGYVVSKISTLRLVDFNKVKNRFEFETSMLINLNIVGAKVADVPIPAVYGSEVSDLKVLEVLPGMLWNSFTGFWERIFYKYIFPNTHPVAVFLATGIAFMLVGIVIGVWSIIVTSGHPTASTTILAVIPFILGFQFCLTALVIDIQNEPK